MQKITLPEGLGLRFATANDQVFIKSLFHSTREAFYLAEQETDYIKDLIEQQQEIQTVGYGTQSPDAITFIVEKQSVAIGRLILDFGKNIAHIIDIALIKEARNKGYGKSIIQAVQYTSTKQAMPVGLTVSTHEPLVKNLYVSLGFETKESTGSHEFMLWYPPASKTYTGI
jgi:ribosomal protein S18 acetylase RimI-like enzyme